MMITLKFTKLKTLIFVFLVLGGGFFINQTNSSVLAIQENDISDFYEPVLTALTNHDAIEISSDADADLLLLPGNGSEFNPYVIENYYIEATNNTGISIHDTTYHYLIKNCFVTADQYGISIYNKFTGYTTIEDCIVTDNFYCGIYVTDEAFTVIENNTVYNNWGYGIYANSAIGTKIRENKLYLNNNPIYVYNTDGSEINNNECWSNNRDSIYVRLSDFCMVYLNTVYDSNENHGYLFEYCDDIDIVANIGYNLSFGIEVDDSDSIVVAGNQISDIVYDGIYILNCPNSDINSNVVSGATSYGMDVISCPFSTIAYNVFTNDGLYIGASNVTEFQSYTVTNNTVNGKPLGFFINLVSDTFSTPVYGQLILINCTAVQLSNQEFYETDICLYLWGCKDTLVQNSDMSYSFLGIDVYNCNNTFIEYSLFEENIIRGIDITSSTYTYIIYSNLVNSEAGVSAYYSSNTTINNNDIVGNKLYGIHLSDCPYSRVMGNNLIQNGLVGLSGVPFPGILVENSQYSNVTHNILEMNGLEISDTTLANYRTYNLTFNDVNGLPYGYFIDQQYVSINSPVYGQLFLVNCSDATISDQIFNFASNGIKLAYCNRCVISSITSVNGKYGIGISYSDNIEISFSIFNNNYVGMYAVSSNFLNIQYSEFLHNSQDGCILSSVDGSVLANCTIAYNGFNGLLLADGQDNLFTRNLLQENKNYGIKLSSSDFNIIHYNTFFENNLEGYNDGMFTGYSQGYDSKTTNIWYHAVNLEGNWYSDWSGVGSYVMDGRLMGPNVDLYPLGGDPPVPIISEYQNITYILIPALVIPIVLISYRRKKK